MTGMDTTPTPPFTVGDRIHWGPPDSFGEVTYVGPTVDVPMAVAVKYDDGICGLFYADRRGDLHTEAEGRACLAPRTAGGAS